MVRGWKLCVEKSGGQSVSASLGDLCDRLSIGVLVLGLL